MLKRLGSAIFQARWNVLVVGLILVMIAAVFGTGVLGVLKSGGFYDPNSESTKAEKLLNERLGGASADVIILMRSQKLKVTERTFARAAQNLISRLKMRPEVRTILSYYSAHDQTFLSKDGYETFALIQLTAADETRKEQDYRNIQSLMKAPPLQVMIAGTVPVNIAFNQLVDADLEHAEIVTFPIVALLLLLVFGGLVAAMVPLVIGGIAIVSTFAVLKIIAEITDISIFAINVVTMLGLGLAIDYALFIVTSFREELSRDERDIKGALERTMATAGRTILFSGLTVSTSLVSLLLFPEIFLHSMGIGAIATILVVMITTLTLLPTFLAILGRHINAFSLRGILSGKRNKEVKLQQIPETQERGAWYCLSEFVMCWPIPVVLVVLVILITLGIPFLHIKFATPDEHSLPAGQEARVVSQHLAQDFATNGNSLIMIAITTPGSALSAKNLASLNSYVQSIKAISGVVSIESLVTVSPSLSLAQYQQLYAHQQAGPKLVAVAAQLANGNYTRVVVQMQPAEHSTAAQDIIRKVRAIVVPPGFVPLVDGVTASQIDLLMNIGALLPYALAILVMMVFILLFLMTGSLLIPLKAILLNILSLTATFGGLVWIFQDGHLQNVFDFPTLGSIDATQPVLIFAIAFGLSMDYEVFLLSRMKECYDITNDNRAAVSAGLQRTGWLITSAALLLAVVLGAFSFAKVIIVQEVGIGLTIAIIMDATLVRSLLVPATMRLLGNWNWWAPKPLRALWMWVGLSESSRVEKKLPEQVKSSEHDCRGERPAVQMGTVSVLSYVPYGYRYMSNQESGGEARFDIDLTEARVVRQIFEWVGRDQCTIDEVLRRLVQVKGQEQTGKIVWDRAAIWGILKNPAYKGEAVFGKTRMEPLCPRWQDQGGGGIQPKRTSSTQYLPVGQWMIIPIPALVDIALFEAVAERLQEYQQRAQSQEQEARYLLQGLIVCRRCGSAYYGKLINQSTSTGEPRLCAYYCCMGTDTDHFNGVRVCENKQLRTDLVDKVVWNEVCQLLKHPERFEQEYQRLYKDAISDLCRINDKIEKLRRGRMRLIDSYAEGLIDKTEFEPCITRMGEQIKHLEEQYQSIKNKTGLEKGLSQLLGGLNDFSSYVKEGLDAIDWLTRREIIRTVVKRVEINQEQVRVVFRVGPSTLFSPSEKTFPRYATV